MHHPDEHLPRSYYAQFPIKLATVVEKKVVCCVADEKKNFPAARKITLANFFPVGRG